MQLTPRAAKMIDDIRSELDPRKVAVLLEDYLTYDDLLLEEQCAAESTCYRQHLLHVEQDGSFSVVALVWLPGQFTPVHDHVSWCVVGTYLGVEEETRYEVCRVGGVDHLVPIGTVTAGKGEVGWLEPPGDIHSVRNSSSGKVISIHVYGADVKALGSSIRRRYDLPVLEWSGAHATRG